MGRRISGLDTTLNLFLNPFSITDHKKGHKPRILIDHELLKLSADGYITLIQDPRRLQTYRRALETFQKVVNSSLGSPKENTSKPLLHSRTILLNILSPKQIAVPGLFIP